MDLRRCSITKTMEESLKIVHLEDSPGGAAIVRQALNNGKLYPEIWVTGTREEFIKALNDFSPDIIISEYTLSDIHCSQAMGILRESKLKIPFIIISDAISDEMAGELLLIGADDYIIKGQAGRLPFAVLRSLEKYHFKREQQFLLEQLTNSEKRFRTLVENSTEAVVVLSAEARPTYVSPAVKNVLGYTAQEVMAMDLFTMAHVDDVAELSKVMIEVLAKPGVPIQGHTGRMLHKDGSWRWIEATVTNLLHDPAINGIVDNFRDVTLKKASEEKILHLNRLYAFLSQVNHTLVHAPDAQTVFKEVCRIACETGKFQAAWIGMTDDESKRRNVVVARGITEEHLAGFINADSEQLELSTVLQSKPYYVSNNIQHEFVSKNWKALSAASGFGSCMVLPIKRSGNIVGSFNLYASETDFFTQAETALLEEAANGISFSLDFFEKKRLKLVADAQLKYKELRLRQAQAIAHLGSWETDLSKDISVWSNEACRIYGLSEEDNLHSGASWLSFVHPDDLAYVIKANKGVLDSMHAADYSHRIVRKDGQIRYLHVQTHVELDSQGKPVSLYGVLQDVTEKEKSQQALLSSESNLRAIFENTSEGFILTDRHAIVRHFNDKSRFFGEFNTEKEIRIGSSLFDAISEQRRADYKQAIANVLAGEIWQYEQVYEKINEEKKWFSVTVNPVHENCQITGLILTIRDVTNQKLSQDQLQNSEANLNAILNNTDALIYSLDTDFKYITCNHAHKSMMKEQYGINVEPGYDIRESLNRFDPGSILEWKQINERAFGGEVLKFEKEIPLNGSSSHFKYSIHPIKKNNTVMGLSCFVNDITPEKQADKKIIKALEEKNVILESIGDGFFAVDRNWIVTYWNAAAEKSLGRRRETMLGKSLWDIYQDVQDLDFHSYYQRAVLTGTVVYFEGFYPTLQAWYSVSAYPSENGLSVFFKDISESKRAMEALAESEKRYSDLFQLSPQPMFVYAMDTLKYLDVNTAAITHYGYSHEEFLAMTILDIRPAEDIPLVQRTVDEHQEQTKVILHGIFRHRKKNGELINVDIQSNIITYRGVKAKVVLANDVTERVRYIQAIEYQNEKLREISWMQSHVIRAPLTRIMALVPMLALPAEPDAEQQLIYDYLIASANELDQVIRSITDVTSVASLK